MRYYSGYQKGSVPFSFQLRAPLVKRNVADPVILAKVGNRYSALSLLEHRHDLHFRKSALLHSNLLV